MADFQIGEIATAKPLTARITSNEPGMHRT